MRLEHDVMMRGGPFGKAFHHQFQKLGHGGKGRMHLKACVMFQLQQHQMIGKAAVLDAEGGQHPLPPVKGHQRKALAIKQEFLAHSQFAVRAEVAVIPKPGQHEPMVDRAPEHVLAHVAPMGGGIGQFHVGLGQGRLHLGDAEVHQAGIAV